MICNHPKPTTANPGLKSMSSHDTIKPSLLGGGFALSFPIKASFIRTTKHVVRWKKVKTFKQTWLKQSVYRVTVTMSNDRENACHLFICYCPSRQKKKTKKERNRSTPTPKKKKIVTLVCWHMPFIYFIMQHKKCWHATYILCQHTCTTY